MSYARFSNSDVYVFFTRGSLECCGCILDEHGRYSSTEGMVDHLNRHIAAGHDVPADVIPALWEDDAGNFPDEPEGGQS